MGSPVSGAELAEVVKKLLGGKFLKALDVVGLYWLMQLCNIAWTSGEVSLH